MDIQNDLDQRQIGMTCFMVGQPELKNQKQAFQLAKKHHIVGRFMVHEFEFRGVCGPQEVGECLNAYDEQTEFPTGSGISFTRHFFPDAFERGWRLASLGEEFWSAFLALHSQYRLGELAQVPMQYFTRAVEWILGENGPNAGAEPDISLDLEILSSLPM